MKTLALIGSPRKTGNTDIMADETLRGAADAGSAVDKIYLDDYLIRPIGEVGDDRPERSDIRADDDYPAILEQFLDSDIIILATPVYWQGFSAQLKCFIDRISSYYCKPEYERRIHGKGFIVLCPFAVPDIEHGKWVTEPAKVIVNALKGKYLGEVCAPGANTKAKVKQFPDILEACYNLGFKSINKERGN